jgi:hypothetical protein
MGLHDLPSQTEADAGAGGFGRVEWAADVQRVGGEVGAFVLDFHDQLALGGIGVEVDDGRLAGFGGLDRVLQQRP